MHICCDDCSHSPLLFFTDGHELHCAAKVEIRTPSLRRFGLGLPKVSRAWEPVPSHPPPLSALRYKMKDSEGYCEHPRPFGTGLPPDPQDNCGEGEICFVVTRLAACLFSSAGLGQTRASEAAAFYHTRQALLARVAWAPCGPIACLAPSLPSPCPALLLDTCAGISPFSAPLWWWTSLLIPLKPAFHFPAIEACICLRVIPLCFGQCCIQCEYHFGLPLDNCICCFRLSDGLAQVIPQRHRHYHFTQQPSVPFQCQCFPPADCVSVGSPCALPCTR